MSSDCKVPACSHHPQRPKSSVGLISPHNTARHCWRNMEKGFETPLRKPCKALSGALQRACKALCPTSGDSLNCSKVRAGFVYFTPSSLPTQNQPRHQYKKHLPNYACKQRRGRFAAGKKPPLLAPRKQKVSKDPDVLVSGLNSVKTCTLNPFFRRKISCQSEANKRRYPPLPLPSC